MKRETKNKMRALSWLFCCLALFASFGCSDSKKGDPSANAGEDQKVLIGDTVEMDGQASANVSKAEWTFVSTPSGSSAEITGADSLIPTFTADKAGTYTLQLSINEGASVDTVKVTSKYVIAAISNDTSSTITTRTRFGTDEYVVDLDDDGGILSAETSRGDITTYLWEQISGPDSTATAGVDNETLPFTAPGFAQFHNESDKYKWQPLPISRNDNNMLFRLTVSDDDGHSDTVTERVYLANDGNEIVSTSGLPNVGLNGIVVLSGPSLRATSAASAAVADWTWTLTRPSGSSAKFINSNSTSSSIQFPSFVPDVAGVYTVAYSSTSGPTSGSLKINASTYVGVGTVAGASPLNPQCGTCHNGVVQSDDVTSDWKETKHASLFEDSYASVLGSAFNTSSLQYHTVGYNPLASNDGFDDLLAEAENLTSAPSSFDDFAASYPDLAALSNVQCESCHGPGAGHSGDPTKIAYTYSASAGVCGQCHNQENQWINSAHNSTGVAHDRGGYQSSWKGVGCQRCHTSKGFATYVAEGHEGLTATVADTGAFVGINCAGCHDPHNATNPDQLRVYGNVTMQNGDTVNTGKAAVCYTCHDGLYNAEEDDCDVNRDGTVNSSDDGDGVTDGICTTFAQSADYYMRQVHYNPQGPVLEGMSDAAMLDVDKDGNDDFTVESSFHGTSGFILSAVTGNSDLADENNKCVTCHMAAGPGIGEEGYNHLGGHAFAVRTGHSIGHLIDEEGGSTEESGDLENTSACTPCHLTLTEFNRTARADYDGDGTTEGIQDEVKGLLLLLTDAIKAKDIAGECLDADTFCVNQAATSGTIDNGSEIVPNTLGWHGANTAAQATSFNSTSDLIRRAVWNHNLIVREGSLGIHNTAFDIKVLQGTYKAVTGSAVPGATIR
jgi:hypothetical protein